jgi:hypothetical protein
LRELTADPFISLDGFASGVKEAAFFGYFGEGLGKWVSDRLHQPQILIMGRLTYDALAQFSPSGTDDVNVRMTELPKLVFSSTLKEPLTWKNTRLAKASIADEITTLKQQPGDPLRSIWQHQSREEHDAARFGESKPFTGTCHNGQLDLFYYRDPGVKVGKPFPLWTIQ